MNNELKQELLSAKIDITMDKIGLKFENIFPESDKNPYRNHHWLVKENSEFIIVNAIPEIENIDNLFWEEWYLNNNEIHHHILTLWKPEYYDEIYLAPEEADDIHPSICFNHHWYVCEEKDMKALLLRR